MVHKSNEYQQITFRFPKDFIPHEIAYTSRFHTSHRLTKEAE